MRIKEGLAISTNLVVIGLVVFTLFRKDGPVGGALVRRYNEMIRQKIIQREWTQIAATRRVDASQAPVALVEFADYECPACRRQHTLYRAIMKTQRAVGVAFRHRPLASHVHAEGAARTAICAEKIGKFPEMHARLFTTDQWLTDTNWTREAVAVGITDTAAFSACRMSDETTARFVADTVLAARLRIYSTPTFVAERFVRVGVMPDSMFVRSGLLSQR